MKSLSVLLILLGVSACSGISDTWAGNGEKSTSPYSDSISIDLKIIDSLLTRADADDVNAMNQLAINYFTGDIVEQDISSALHWMSEAASRNSFDACLTIGNSYLYGWDGFSSNEDSKPLRNYTTAEKIFLIAADAGNIEAYEKLGFLYFIWDKGNVDIDSKQSSDQHFPKSLYWYKLAAENDSVIGKYHMGLFHYYGLGVEESAIKTLTYIREAADMGFEPAKILYPIFREEYISNHRNILY